MTDYFELLGVPRRPWLDPDSLKQKFLARAAELHPDHNPAEAGVSANRKVQDRYTEFNAAYNCLRNPKARLSHLIQLEKGVSPSELQNVPADLMQVFMEVGATCRQVDRFLTEKAAATSPLLKVQLFECSQDLSEQATALRARLSASQEEHLNALKRVDAEWERSEPSTKPALLHQLEEIRRLLGFFDRWISQLQERFVQLSL
jgi:curved DNA-binding protein CbpA